MEYDSESSCDDRLRDLDISEGDPQLGPAQQINKYSRAYKSPPWHSIPVASTQSRLRLNTVNKTLSAQVMEYYHKYSQSTKLDQYFSLPTPSASPEAVKYYCSIYEVNPMLGTNRQECIGEEYNLRSYVPRERRRWVRPALIGQSSAADASNQSVQPLTDLQSVSPDLKRGTPDTIPEEKNESRETLQDPCERKTSSPTSSIASHKPLEWDSGADVGYFNSLPNNKQSNKKLSTIERMALARGCSAALRLDPEGTTESEVSGKITIVQTRLRSAVMPKANSTTLTENASGSEGELEITPIVKNHLPGIINGSDIKSHEKYHSTDKEATTQSSNNDGLINDTPKSSFAFKVPHVKYLTECKKVRSKQNEHNQNLLTLPLKKSTSMNTLTIQSSKLTLKRSQSDLNLLSKDKNRGVLPLIFNSTSSIATVVNKPTTSDKVVQTSINQCSQESIGVQVSVLDEEKPPLPKRGTSLQKSLQSILKNPKGTYKIEDTKNQNDSRSSRKINSNERLNIDKPQHNSTEISYNDSTPPTPRADDTENMTGRANSFEYFPGHIYENVPNGSGSRISSVGTGESNSTIPNTSSSIDEKLWGDSDSLVRDLERSVNILKSLVDANKCDKQVKKRLIHHVVKRLVTAKYTDDKIEHNLEDNVPWNPDDARKKVYRAEILQALAKKHSTTDSSDDWKPQKKNGCIKKPTENKRETTKELPLGSSNSDKFDGHTDRTENDGRKARMGLRTDDCPHNSHSPTDPEKSESSDCFFPPRNRKNSKAKNIFCLKDKLPRDESSTTNSTPPDHNRILLDAVVNNRRTPIESSNNTENNTDWRLPTTLSERQFELKKCTNSDSGDSKLVSYAQMEKRNQLDWITNEIVHLCNLKKLLEQPRKLERPKSSPRKSKQPSFKQKPFTVLTCLHDQSGDADYLQSVSRSMQNSRDNPVNEQWSSHCNLATCEPTGSTRHTLQQLGKRNSCAQTATDNTYAHSRTGGEIVSIANTHGSSVKFVSTGTQTQFQEVLSTESDIEQCVACPIHKPAIHMPNSPTLQYRKYSSENTQCTCTHCLDNQSQPIKDRKHKLVGTDYFHGDKPLTSRLPSSNSEDSVCGSEMAHHWHKKQNGIDHLKQKDTKNQINATKSKYTCDASPCQCINDCMCKKNYFEGKTTEHSRELLRACPMCPKESQESTKLESEYRACRNEHSQKGNCCKYESHCTRNVKNGNTAKKCSCDRVGSRDHIDEKIVSMRHEQHQVENGGETSYRNSNENVTTFCRCSSNCVCENRQQGENRAHKSCECCSGSKYRTKIDDRQPESHSRMVNGHDTQQQRVQTNIKCNCGKDCSCANKFKTTDEQFYSTKCGGQSNRTSESASNDSGKTCRCCRTCGLVYQSTKKCNCHEVYPKSVAYEISFAKKDEHKNNDTSNVNALPRVSMTNPYQNNGKPNNCACEKTKVDDSNKNSRINTLQDFLSKNKPEFVNNAETRRQFMSEISHLRELRKEKRLQLLAMASSTPAVSKSPKPSSKPATYTQRRITDEEMKERLRKRYYRLNEVRSKRQQREKQEELRRNKLMAKIFGKKLQQKVLRGQVDLSQSVSVVSNL